jgi:IS30 family transposase
MFKWLRKWPRNHYQRWSYQDHHDLAWMRAQGWSKKKIARKLGRTPRAVDFKTSRRNQW